MNTDDILQAHAKHMQSVSTRLDEARNQAVEQGAGPLDPNSIRGRLVLAKAIAYALSAIDLLPKNRQEWSDRQDMANILLTSFDPGLAVMAVQSAEAHTAITIDVTDHKSDPE